MQPFFVFGERSPGPRGTGIESRVGLVAERHHAAMSHHLMGSAEHDRECNTGYPTRSSDTCGAKEGVATAIRVSRKKTRQRRVGIGMSRRNSSDRIAAIHDDLLAVDVPGTVRGQKH